MFSAGFFFAFMRSSTTDLGTETMRWRASVKALKVSVFGVGFMCSIIHRMRGDEVLPRIRVTRNVYAIICKNSDCVKPIVLPLPILHENSASRLLWPTDGKPRNFLCRDCNHVYEYMAEDVQMGPYDEQAQAEAQVDDTVFQIEARCGKENCGLPIYILLTAPSWQTTIAVAHDWLEEDKHGTARCSCGHETGKIIPGSVDVHIDSNWK